MKKEVAKQQAEYHRSQASEHDRAGYPNLAQWHREMAAMFDPPPRRTFAKKPKVDVEEIQREEFQRSIAGTDRMGRVARVNNARPPSGTRITSLGPQGRTLARKRAA